jgi:hypothetical protein
MSKNNLLMKFRRKNRINKEIGDLMKDNNMSRNSYSLMVNESKTHLIARISVHQTLNTRTESSK